MLLKLNELLSVSRKEEIIEKSDKHITSRNTRRWMEENHKENVRRKWEVKSFTLRNVF